MSLRLAASLWRLMEPLSGLASGLPVAGGGVASTGFGAVVEASGEVVRHHVTLSLPGAMNRRHRWRARISRRSRTQEEAFPGRQVRGCALSKKHTHAGVGVGV
ncbi:hypothetical protein PLESTM_001792000 [Pleodorina starrii]|nr:hypothetical protein PLESTM_001792000 [Pleodorina starrii]